MAKKNDVQVGTKSKPTKKMLLWNMCCEEGLIKGDVSYYNAKGYTVKNLEAMLAENKSKLNSKKESEENEMAKKNTVTKKTTDLEVGTKFLMKVKNEISEYEVIELQEKVAVLKDEDGNERKFLLTIVNSNFKKQDELLAELEEDDEDEELDDIEDEDIVDDEDDDEEDEEDEEEEEEPAPKKGKAKKEPKKASKKAPAKKSNKYWENEDPIVAELSSNEIRFYEEAGKFQLFAKIENRKANDGSMMITKGVTVDVGDMSEKDAMKFIANVVYAMKDRVIDERLEEAIDILEDLNKEVNPEDYVFAKKELDGMETDVLKTILKELGVSKAPAKKSAMVKRILDIQADAE